jgi:hypothetical protein
MTPDPFPVTNRPRRLDAVRSKLPGLLTGSRVVGWLYGASLLALVAGVFVAPVVLVVGFDVAPLEAVRTTLAAGLVGYLLWLVPLLGDPRT